MTGNSARASCQRTPSTASGEERRVLRGSDAGDRKPRDKSNGQRQLAHIDLPRC